MLAPAQLRPTALGVKGLVFFSMIFGAFLAAPYTNLFFLLLGFLAVLAVSTTLWTARHLNGLDGEIADVEPSPAGAGPLVRVVLRGRGGVRADVTAELRLNGRRHRFASVPFTAPGERLCGRLPGLARGRYEITRAGLTTTWPFGLLRVTRPVPAPSELIVYPEPAQLGAARARDELLAEASGDAAPAAGDRGPAGVREFRPGDDPRHVDWKATARRGDLTIKEWEANSTRGLEIVLDRRCPSDALEHALSWIAALVLSARENKERIRLHTQGTSATYGDGHRTWRELWRLLATCTPLNRPAPPPPATSPDVPRLPAGSRS